MTKRNYYLFLFVSLFMLLAPNLAAACTCELPPLNKSIALQVMEARQKSKALFVGKVLQIVALEESLFTTVTFEVESAWKGVESAEVKVFTGRGGSCGFPFEVGETYLVYAYESNGNLGTNICQRTRPVGGASDELQLLGEPSFKTRAHATSDSASVKFEVLDTRPLTENEMKNLGNVKGVTLAVRLRLTNMGVSHILYLSNSGTVVPAGYQLLRELGKLDWKSTGRTRGREGPPGSELTGSSYSWIELPPGAVVEIDAHDWSKSNEEHAFSTFLKDSPDSKGEEVMTKPYRPLE